MRTLWNLGLDTIPNLAEFLEERGIKVMVIPLPARYPDWLARSASARADPCRSLSSTRPTRASASV